MRRTAPRWYDPRHDPLFAHGCVSPFPLLRLLADGKSHSGGSLGERLGVPLAEVAAGVRSIEGLGIRVSDLHGPAYRLTDPIDLLDREGLARSLQAHSTGVAVEILDECPSTNAVLMERARAGAPHASALACERQTAGRGRRGKTWHSGIGTDLTFSLLWRFRQGTGALSGLSLAVGVALARALARFGHADVQLKWPNDLMLHGRKLGGILIEVAGESAGPSAVVIGVGINVYASAARAAAVDQPATALSEHGGVASRTALLAAALAELGEALGEFARCGFASFRAEWLERHVWQGRRVTLRVAEREVAEGEAVGVGEDGALLLRSARGVQPFHSGELRLAER